MAFCRFCNAEITWIITNTNKKMPLDTKPIKIVEDKSNRALAFTLDGKIIRGREVDEAYQGHCDMAYISHFATCTNYKEV